MRIKIAVTMVLLMLACDTVWAGEAPLPLNLSWCSSQAEVLASYPAAREMTEDVYDISTTLWGVEGFVSLVFDIGRLIGIRIRAFETEGDVKKFRSQMERQYGSGGVSGTTTNWSPGNGQTVQLKLQSEQIFLNFEVAVERCEDGVKRSREPSEQELKDAEAMKRKDLLDWDPYSDDPEKRIVEKKKKKDAEKKKDEKKKDDDPEFKDGEIDW